MFGTLINVDRDGNVFLSDKGIVLLPKLFAVYKHSRMGSDMVKWIVGVYDYESPYRKLPLEQRISTVTYNLFKKKKHSYCADEVVKEAVIEYELNQYDELVEAYNLLRQKNFERMQRLKALSVVPENMDEINRLQHEIVKATEEIDKLKGIIIKNQQEHVNIRGKKEVTFSVMEERQRMDKHKSSK